MATTIVVGNRAVGRPVRPGDPVELHIPPMPFSTRLRVAQGLNEAWRDFVTEMHDGELGGPDVAEKFWKYLTR